jgi:flavin reductase (DIM6/NTAB) family NADH-FMN oxidoreductase RutF
MPPEAAEFRAAMARIPTGVTVVAANGADGPAGATASAVASLSLEPMLMLACLDRGSRTLLAVKAADRFGISVLAGDQEDVARAFSTKGPVADKWSGIDWQERGGLPAINGAALWVACELHDMIGGGDHVIITGAVIDFEARDAAPLIYHRGEYRPLR